MRIIARFSKGKEVRFVSHLDVQRLFGRAFRRAGMPVAYSQGFNPHPVLAFATALAIGVTSDAEWLDVKLERDIPCAAFIQGVNAALPEGFHILETLEVEEKLPSLTALLSGANYTIIFDGNLDEVQLQTALETLLSGPITITKRTKGGMKPVDIRPQVLSAEFGHTDENQLSLKLNGVLNASGSLNPDVFMQELFSRAGSGMNYRINRDAVLFTNGRSTPV
jgi:radical SAM-linked protein